MWFDFFFYSDSLDRDVGLNIFYSTERDWCGIKSDITRSSRWQKC